MLITRNHWIFDMDGTLTRGIHDFAAIRRELGLPEDRGIGASLDAMDPKKAAPLHVRLEAIERELAHRAVAEPDATALVEALHHRGARLGVLTRNTLELARITLKAANLARFFDDTLLMGRGCAAPKPAPDGVLHLMNTWGADPNDTVMVGDFLFDIQAGRAAGVATVLIERDGAGRWPGVADRTVQALTELL